MAKQPRILAFAGSLREKAYTKRIVKVAAAGARAAGAEITYVDLKDYPMPIYNTDLQDTQGFPPIATAFQRLLLEHDGLLIATPEYNGSLPAALKNVIDWTSRAIGDLKTADCYRGKFAAIMTASPGSFGGFRCLAHLRDVLTMLHVCTLPTEIAVSFVASKFDGDGDEMVDDRMQATLEDLGASLVAMLRKTLAEEAETIETQTADVNG